MVYQFQIRFPLDSHPYARDPRSQPLTRQTSDGTYVYLRNTSGLLWVLPDGIHLHPKLLGSGLPATYAGDLTIVNGVVVEITNCSGTFQFDDRQGLVEVAHEVVSLGIPMAASAIRFFPPDGGPIEILG